jgi:hypothetical protein
MVHDKNHVDQSRAAALATLYAGTERGPTRQKTIADVVSFSGQYEDGCQRSDREWG